MALIVCQSNPDLCEKTKKLGKALVKNKDPLAIAWILQFELALRAKEIVNLKWNWFVPRGEHYALLIIDRPSEEFTAKGTNREIQVHRKLYEKLISLGNDSEFICPGTTENARMNYITRVLADWIRCIGWSVDIFPKAGYELRKLKGSDWFTKLGPAVAQEWLGHKSIETTMKYYACLATPPPPPAPEW